MPADFTIALKLVLNNEGGYAIDPSDPGGETYKGVSRKIWSGWDGWVNLDLNKQKTGFPANLESDSDLQSKVSHFYESNFWNRIRGGELNDQRVANSIFDFAVNAGAGVSLGLAQTVVDLDADGVMSDNSLIKINNSDPQVFLASFTLAKIARYITIVKRRPISQKYFYGWIRRAMGDI